VHTVAIVLAAIVALEHAYFLYLEMFRWTSPSTLKAFGLTAAFAAESKVLAANQGLYNGFLAAGLIWAILAPLHNAVLGNEIQRPLIIFFSSCVLVAGIYGGLTVTRRIFLIQALPGALCLAAALAFG
jgi:putative membrane protein